ncbi:aldo/keto reductase [candidate division KSB1 bacterium]
MSDKRCIDRRNFLKASLAAGVCTTGIIENNKIKTDLSIQPGDINIKEYRTLGRTGFRVSDIGFGASFLTVPGLLDRALQMGVNYIDTGEHYSGGQSESTIGQVINKHDRKSIFITTKLNIRMGRGRTLKERFYQCLERMQTDYADCLMIHMTPDVEQVKNEEFHKTYQELKSDGKVNFLGLSNHGKEQSIYGNTTVEMTDVMLAAAEDGRFDAALFVYNFLQKEQGEKIIRKFKEKNMGVTLMKTNPVNVYSRWLASYEDNMRRGRQPSERSKKLKEEYNEWLKQADSFKEKYELTTDREISDVATKFCLSNPDVHSVCPTITNFDMLNNFVSLSGQKLSETDSSRLTDYKETLGRYYCRHACGICLPACPHEVPVNTIMRYNHYFEAQGREKQAMQKYAALSKEKAGKCSDCTGYCEGKCPYNVPVRSLLINAHINLSLV